jgi:hypothetical protein
VLRKVASLKEGSRGGSSSDIKEVCLSVKSRWSCVAHHRLIAGRQSRGGLGRIPGLPQVGISPAIAGDSYAPE